MRNASKTIPVLDLPFDMRDATPVPSLQNRCLHELFEAQEARSPEAIALTCGDQALSYRELNQRANQVAHMLRVRGIGPENLVGLCVERSLEMIVGMLGILKAGAAYVPLDPSYPAERLAYIVQDAQITTLLTTGLTRNKSVQQNSHENCLVCLDNEEEQDALARQPATNPICTSDPEHLAYVIYTSGSTGLPKGVLITHKSVVNHATAMARLYELCPSDRILQFSSISFDVAVEEFFPSWLGGATVVLLPDALPLIPATFLKFVEQEALTVLNLPPAYWRDGVAALADSQSGLSPLVRLVVVGGEAVSSESLLAWQKLVSTRVRWLNAYGPTETTITSTVYEPPVQQPQLPGQTVPIGRAIGNLRMYVLDADYQPVPIDEPGELYIGGAGLARGYHNRPDLTAERFLPDPFSGRSGQRLYRTGDRVRCRADGQLEFLGRVDHQVKIRGFRIELEEIEAVIRQYTGIKEAIVVAREDTPGEKRLVAYILPEPEAPFTTQQLRHYLQNKLPGYMIPVVIMTLEYLPLSPNGKLDRRKLPTPSSERPGLEERYMPPRNALEETLVEMWTTVLGVRQIGVYDNFFALGGHSLLATQILALIKSTLGVDLPVRVLFEQPCVTELAQIVAQAQERSQNTVPQKNSQILTMGKEDIEHLLADLDQLSDAEVDSLLSSLLSEQEENM